MSFPIDQCGNSNLYQLHFKDNVSIHKIQMFYVIFLMSSKWQFSIIQMAYLLLKNDVITQKNITFHVINYLLMAIFYVSLHPMKKGLLIIGFFCVCVIPSIAQVPRIILPDSSLITSDPDSLELLHEKVGQGIDPNHEHSDSIQSNSDSLVEVPEIIAWKIDPRTGDRYSVPMDTLIFNYQHETMVEGYSPAMGYLGALGSPLLYKTYLDRPETDYFIFNQAYYPYLKRPGSQYFFNTRRPYSQLNYQRLIGNRENNEERFKGLIDMNFGKELNVGVEGDIIFSKGFYNSQSVRHYLWSIFGSYNSDKLEAHLFATTGKSSNFENGGIADENFILKPDSINQSFESKDIPTNISETWNTLKNDQFYLTGKYNFGYYKAHPTVDTLKGEFVPVASILLTSHIRSQYRRFLSHDTTSVKIDGVPYAHRIDQFYSNIYYPKAVDDSTRFSSIKNTVGLSLRECFRPWVKFGLTAFLEHDLRNYSMVDSTGVGRTSHRENSVVLGGVLSKQQGENLKFNIRADLGVLGANLGEFNAIGDVTTGFTLGGKRTELSANGYVKNLKPKYLQEHYHSKYFWWDKNFGDIRKVFVGGKLFIPFTNTTISAGVENVQNYLYLDANREMMQESSNIQVLSATVDQRLHAGIFHFDNQFVYQTSSNQNVIPVPTFSLYSNLYLKTLVANVLTLQLGVDMNYHTKYFAPGYEPALLQFYNQQKREIGDYPFATIYANLHLKQTRFFVTYYNAGSLLTDIDDYFSLPGYPVNPPMFRMGVSINLHE